MKIHKKEKKIIEMNIALKKVDMENFIIDGIFSTEDEDRHGEIVYQNWDLKNFKKNPVIINSHNYGDITEILGRAVDITNDKETKKLVGSIQFAVAENPKAKIAFDLYAGGFARAFSVGFMPKEFNDKGDILKAELLEISLVSVPANALALAKAKGIDVEQLYGKTTDGDNTDIENTDEKTKKLDNSQRGNNESEGNSEAEREEAERLEAEKLNQELEKEEKVLKDKEEKKVKLGDKCEMIDGSEGIMIEGENGGLICGLPKKSIKKIPSHILKGVVEDEIEIKKRALQRICSAVKLVSESIKAETRQEIGDRAETNLLINRTIRMLKKLK